MNKEWKATLAKAAKRFFTLAPPGASWGYYVGVYGLPLIAAVVFTHWFGVDFTITAFLIILGISFSLGILLLHLSRTKKK